MSEMHARPNQLVFLIGFGNSGRGRITSLDQSDRNVSPIRVRLCIEVRTLRILSGAKWSSKWEFHFFDVGPTLAAEGLRTHVRTFDLVVDRDSHSRRALKTHGARSLLKLGYKT